MLAIEATEQPGRRFAFTVAPSAAALPTAPRNHLLGRTRWRRSDATDFLRACIGAPVEAPGSVVHVDDTGDDVPPSPPPHDPAQAAEAAAAELATIAEAAQVLALLEEAPSSTAAAPPSAAASEQALPALDEEEGGFPLGFAGDEDGIAPGFHFVLGNGREAAAERGGGGGDDVAFAGGASNLHGGASGAAAELSSKRPRRAADAPTFDVTAGAAQPLDASTPIAEAGLSLDALPRADTSTGYLGVYPSHGRYMARIYINHKTRHLGHFNTIAKAAKVRDKGASAHDATRGSK